MLKRRCLAEPGGAASDWNLFKPPFIRLRIEPTSFRLFPLSSRKFVDSGSQRSCAGGSLFFNAKSTSSTSAATKAPTTAGEVSEKDLYATTIKGALIKATVLHLSVLTTVAPPS